MEVSKGSVVVFVDGTFPPFLKFIVRNIIDGLLLLDCSETMYVIGNIHPSQVKVME